MNKKLLIVESPSKTVTIKQYLGNEFEVKSSVGHIRDLSTRGYKGLGLDIEHDFKPMYDTIREKAKVIKELNNACSEADEIYLATDPDREGEAISWHLKEVLNLKGKYVKRIVFNEITKKAILSSLENSRDIDDLLVSSQETRRIIDRIIGFLLSKLLQYKIKSKSAGRVQSVALKLICDREKEINAFLIEDYYEIIAKFADFKAKLYKYNDKQERINTLEDANKIIEGLSKDFLVQSVEKKNHSKLPEPPFITSTLQQVASIKLNMTSKKTMQVAQGLYEGKALGKETVGLISYMRTDSTRLSEDFIDELKKYIKETYGESYLGHLHSKNNTKNVQDAHEAIRPTDIRRTPESVKDYLSKDEYNLYNLIYKRTVASLMKDAIYETTTVLLKNNNAIFRVSGETIVYDGYLKIYKTFDINEEDNEKNNLKKVAKDMVLEAQQVESVMKSTEPPARYTEAKLIKEMEELGIGRPSTYAQTISTLKERQYVKLEKKKFIPTEQGILTSDQLAIYFNKIINVEYTARMEKMLDEIASGEHSQKEIVPKFYYSFLPMLEKAEKEMEKVKPVETGEICPLCGSKMVKRTSKYGTFDACGNYPECKYIKKKEKTHEDTGILCPNCHTGHIVAKIALKGKNKGNTFYACDNYPKCKTIMNELPENK